MRLIYIKSYPTKLFEDSARVRDLRENLVTHEKGLAGCAAVIILPRAFLEN